MSNYKIKGSNNTYATPFDLMASENILTDNAHIQQFEGAGGDITFYDFVKQANELLCKDCKDKPNTNENNARIGSSGDSARIGSSGDSARIGSSGNYARIGSSGNYARIGSSGNYARIGSSGNYARIGSSGYSAQIGSSGYSARIGSSGYSAQIGSSGNYARIGSSGYSAQIGSSGNYAQIGSSGYSAQIGSSGNYARIGSSGNSAQIGSSGDSARIGSSGNYARIEVTGKNSIASGVGYRDIFKGANGAWFSLADYIRDEHGNFIPCLIKAGQIGVSIDWKGQPLKENQYYMLISDEFTPIAIVDGDYMIPLTEKDFNGYKVMHCQYESDYRNKKKNARKVWVAKKDGYTAHGEDIKEAIADCDFKHQQSRDVAEHVERIKDTGKMTANDYRLITGACRYGTERFLTEKGYAWADEKTIEEVLKITEGQYGHERFREVMGL